MKKAISLAAASVLLMSAFTTSMAYAAPAASEPVPIVAAAAEGATDKTPRQLNVHMGDDPSTQVNVTYTTAAECPSVITVKKQGGHRYQELCRRVRLRPGQQVLP